jgi:hypothetical protein
MTLVEMNASAVFHDQILTNHLNMIDSLDFWHGKFIIKLMAKRVDCTYRLKELKRLHRLHNSKIIILRDYFFLERESVILGWLDAFRRQ